MRSPAIELDAERQRADAADLRICGVFVVASVIGVTWFYCNVLCAALRLVQ